MTSSLPKRFRPGGNGPFRIGGDPVSIEIVVPAHNEESRIAEALAWHLEYFGPAVRFTVILDHCDDGTASVVGELEQRFGALSHAELAEGRGKGSAVLFGMRHSEADVVGFMDADAPVPPAEIARLIETLADADGAIASRYLPASLIASPRAVRRTLASRILNFAVRRLFGLSFRDTQCGAKVFRRRAIAPVLDEVELTNWLFDVEMLVLAGIHGLAVREVPVVWSERTGSHLDIGGFVFEAGWSLAKLRMRAWRLRRAVRRGPRTDGSAVGDGRAAG